jgi:hypothetical protein
VEYKREEHTMKSKLRVALLSLVAVLSLGSMQAVGATAASAATNTPRFAEQLPASYSFSGKESVFENTAGTKYACQSVSGVTELVSWSALSTTLRFKGCSAKVTGFTFPCTSTGAPSGEIVSNSLTASLVYLSSTKHEVMLDFAQGGSGKTLAAFSCGSQAFQLNGSFLARANPINTPTAAFQLSAKGSKGSQELTQYEGSNGEKLSAKSELCFNGSCSQADANLTGFELLSQKITWISG